MTSSATATPSKTAFAQHTAADTALQTNVESTDDGNTNTQQQGLTIFGRVAIFVLLPFGVGLMGLYFSWLELRKKPDKEISLDRDFLLPFLLALALAIVVGIQTSGYKAREIQPLIAWPKVKRVKKVVKRTRKKEPIKEE